MKNKLWNEKRREALNKILDIKGSGFWLVL